MPYKRFAAPCLLALATRYLDENRTTYRASVRHDRCLIGYPFTKSNAVGSEMDPPQDQDVAGQRNGRDRGDQAVIPPSLVWRLLGWLGGLNLVLDRAREMILQHDPNSLCHRISGSVAPHKARSEDRLATLQTARQLLLILPEWEERFTCKFFPRFATRSGFD